MKVRDVPFQRVRWLGLWLGAMVGLAAASRGDVGSLHVTEEHGGLSNHVVIVESTGRFRVAVVRGCAYGLSQWYDLVNDPQATLDLTRHPTPWNTVNRVRNDAEDTHYMVTHTHPPHVEDEGDQGSLFNQLVNPGDATLHCGPIAGFPHVEVPCSCRIVEQNPVRVILETTFRAGGAVLPQVSFTTTYALYASGRIGVVNTISANADQVIELWRSAIISLGDPTYHFSGVAQGECTISNGVLSDATQSWAPDALAGFQVNLPDYVTYEVLGNTATQIRLGRQTHGQKPALGGHYQVNSQIGRFGWLRCSDLQSPYGWQGTTSAYLREYWDPETPAPFTHRTKASLLLVPQPDNPIQGGQGMHGWDFFKRFYYECGTFTIKAGQGVTQRYLLQLGTQGDTVLPDLSSQDLAKACADDYRRPVELKMEVGSLGQPAFDFGLACHRLAAVSGQVTFVPTRSMVNPVFEVEGLSGAIRVATNDIPLTYTNASPTSHSVVLQVWGQLGPGAPVTISAKK